MRRAVIYTGKSDFERLFGEMLRLSLSEEGAEAVLADSGEDPFGDIYSGNVFAAVSIEQDEEIFKRLIAMDDGLPYESTVLYGFDDIECKARYLRHPFDISDFLAPALDFCLERTEDEKSCSAEDVKNESGADAALSDDAIFDTRSQNETGLLYNADEKAFYYGGVRLDFTRREQELLMCLYSKRGNSVSREEAAITVWGRSKNTNVVDVYIKYLRQKLDERFDKKIIYTVRNGGYMLK